MIWYAYRHVIFTAPDDRDHPLNSDESRRLTQDLNTIYINIRGVIDNLCWSLLHEFAPDSLRSLTPSKVDLFSRSILKLIGSEQIDECISRHDKWYIELKTRRDPSAHRIPLTVPPQLVDSAEAETYSAKAAAVWEAIGQMDFEAAQRMMTEQENIGRFVPWFLHDPEQGPIPIYPTLSEDLRHLVEIFRVVSACLI